MNLLRYSDFDLLIERMGEGLRARVISSPAGEGYADLTVPVSEEKLREFITVHRPRDAVVKDEGSEVVDLNVIKEIGARLYEGIFTDTVGDLFRDSLGEVARYRTGLRLRLRLDDATLAQLPWEFLYDGRLDRFFCLSTDTPLVRYPELQEKVRIVRVDPPLRILVMISSPVDYPRLDAEEEWVRLRGALRDVIDRNLVTLERLDEANLPALRHRLTQADFHIFHYIGHGGWDEKGEGGVLLLEDAAESGALVPGGDLGRLLHAHRSLRLVVLNACEGARSSPDDPFAGTANAIVKQGVPAVIAMQFAISDDAAITFAQQLYAAVARGYPVDAALAEARRTIYFGGNRVEWATPVLYMRSPNGRIFNVRGQVARVAPVAEVDPLAPEEPEERGLNGEIAVRDMTFHVNNDPGTAITRRADERAPVPRRRQPPRDLRPKDFPGLVGREREVHQAAELFFENSESPLPVEVFGAEGIGKTALVRNLAHHPAAQFPDGVVYSASPQPIDDLLIFLFQTFYETETAIKPSEADLRHYLHEVRALVQLDDVGHDREGLEFLANVAPGCLLLISTPRRTLLDEGPALSLKGLSEVAAVQLIERRIGRRIADGEMAAAKRIWGAVEGVPLRLVQAAARVRDDGLALEQVAKETESATAARPIVTLDDLSVPERRAVAVMYAARAPVEGDLLGRAAELAHPESVLEGLVGRGIAQVHSPRYSLTETPSQRSREEIADTTWPERAIDILTAWAEEHQDDPAAILEQADALMGLLRWAAERSENDRVIRLGRALERTFAVAARWGRWGEVLARVLDAARQVESQWDEAWALHQLGTRYIGLDQPGMARESLLRALHIREELGDAPGIDVTRQNLEFAGGAPPPSDSGPEPEPEGPGPEPVPPGRPWGWILLGVVTVAVLIVAGLFLLPDDDVEADVVPVGDNPGFNVEPDALEFADQEIDTESPASVVTIVSTGERALRIRDASVERDDAGVFAIGENTCGTRLQRGAECTISVVFVPPEEGAFEGELIAVHNAADDPLVIPLSGTGTAAGSTEPGTPQIEVDPPEGLSFPAGEPFDKTLTVAAGGDAPLQVESVSLESTTEGFSITGNTCGEPIEPGATCTVDIHFTPSPEVVGSTVLLVESNATTEALRVPLSGVPGPVVTVSPFEFVDETGSTQAVAAVSNNGTAAFTVTGAETTDSGVFPIRNNGCATVGVGSTCQITIGFVDNCPITEYVEQLTVHHSVGSSSVELVHETSCVD